MALYVGYMSGGNFVFEHVTGVGSPIPAKNTESFVFFSPVGQAGSNGTIDEIMADANQSNYVVSAAQMRTIALASLTGL